MQADNLEPNAAVFVPLLAEAGTADLTATQADFMAQLTNWDGQATADSAPAAFFESFWKHLLQDTFNDDLPEERAPEGGSRWNQVMRNLPADSPWWDDQTTSEVVENRADMVTRARGEALQELEKTLGKDPAAWRWGDLHTATFRNQTLGKSGIALIESLFNRGGFPVGGSSSIVNATGWSLSKGYEVKALPSMRMIVDLSDLNNSVTVNTTGQSGHAYHPHYIDMAPLWASVQYYPMLWGREQVLQNQSEHLVLNPAR
jgi:penicillin amidase